VLALDQLAYAMSSHPWDDVDLIVLLITLIDFPAIILARAVCLGIGGYACPVAVQVIVVLLTGFIWYYFLGWILRGLMRWRHE
jgi:hypothetical protein